MVRVGIGYDIHRLVEGRKLVLGGIVIPYPRGLLGHSDADVLVHALCDALLGAAGLGDIGQHFPDTDPAYKDIDSMELLSRTKMLVAEQGLKLGNLDATIFAEKPSLAPYRSAMQNNLAQAMAAPPQRVNIKATTTEGLGVIGKGAGIGAMVVVVLQTDPS
ncbi:2-C-methyl-D-erythritol 2,4-cyclodiphosphate synthase [Thermodesulfobacteriota bacterium]